MGTSKLSAKQKISDGTSFWPKISDRNYVVGPRITSFTMGNRMIVVSMVTLSHSGVTWGHLGPTLGHFEHTLCHLGGHLGVTLGHLGVTLKPGAHFGPLCSWNATFCNIILSEEMEQRLLCGTG